METVKIVKDNHAGYAIINKSDFDPARHILYGVSELPALKAPKEAKPIKARK